ncbi:bone morphogenetic protein 1 isoform X1 [Vespula squamosa]|uniref:Bone morphogenetic protein 1 isoform X1 n=1 Tax=Vespula squamosa TaxID=30214 RepID=A0ABD2AEW4_VESSQ
MTASAAMVPTDSYVIPAVSAAASILVVLFVCLLCHKLKRPVQEVHIDDLHQRVEERHHCYHHHTLLRHHQDHIHEFNQYQLEQPSPPSDSDAEQVCGDETSSPDSV